MWTSSSQSAELAHWRDFRHFVLGHLVLEVKVSAMWGYKLCCASSPQDPGIALRLSVHSYNSAFRHNSEAEAHSHSMYLYSIAECNPLGCSGAAAGERTCTTASGAMQLQLESRAARRCWQGKRANELHKKVATVRSPQKRLGVVDLGASLFKQQSSFNCQKSASWLLVILVLYEILWVSSSGAKESLTE